MSDLPEHKQSPDDVIFNKESNNRLAGAVTFAYLEPLRNKPVSTKGHDNLSDALKKTAFLSDEAAVQKQNDIPVSRGSIYAGLSVSGKNTWLLSEETFSGLNKHNLNTTKFNFLNDLGVTVIYSPNLKWSFEGNGFVSSKNGQSYRQYINGLYSDKSYVLRYSSVELTAQRNISKRTVKSKPVVMINAGLYLSYLHSAYKILNSLEYNISGEYSPFDYGMIIGSGIEIPVLENFILMPGLRIRYGLPNIFAGQEDFPATLNTTRNASVEFRVSFLMPIRKL
jgi:hypothetical protein